MDTISDSPPPAAEASSGFSGLASGAFRRRSGAPLSALWLGLRLARSGWRYLLVVALNLALVAALVCANALFTTFLTAMTLQEQLASQSRGATNVDVAVVQTRLTTSAEHDEALAVSSVARSTLAAFAPGASTNFITAAPQMLDNINGNEPPNLTLIQPEGYDIAQLSPHITLSAGALPKLTSDPTLPEGLITQQMAQVDGVHVGDVIMLRAGYVFSGLTWLTVKVAGVWTPTHAADPFWNGHSFLSEPIHDSDPFIFAVLLPREVMAPFLAQTDLPTTAHWIFYSQTNAITPARVSDIDTRLKAFRSGLAVALASQSNVVGAQTITGLDTILKDVLLQRQRFTLAIESIGTLALGLALLTLALVTQLFIERDRPMLATMRSRGASATQVIGAYLLLMAVVGGVSALGGVALMARLAPGLFLRFVAAPAGRVGVVTNGYLASQVDLRSLVELGLACALVAVVIAGWSAFLTLRSNVRSLAVASGGNRGAPFWQRTYLDLLVAALCVAGYLDLAFYDGAEIVPGAVQGAPSPLLVGAPLLLALAAVLTLLRVFPLVARLWAALASRGRGATGLLASVRLVRGQTQVALQPLLLMLAISIVFLACAYQVSVDQMAAAQSTYLTGADIRLLETATESPQGDALIQSRLARLPGLAAKTPVYRGVTHDTPFWNVLSGSQQGAIDTLGIDPRTWATVSGSTSWRSTYSPTPLSALMAQLAAHERATLAGAAPVGSAENPIWALVSQGFAQTHHVQPGKTFKLLLPGNLHDTSIFAVSAVVADFPTLHGSDASGIFIVPSARSLFAAMRLQPEGRNVSPGPNEYWLRGADALLPAVEAQQGSLDVDSVVARQRIAASLLSAPSLVGVRALLLFGGGAITLLALLAAALQTTVDTRQREPEIQAMRALGVSQRVLAASLIGERVFCALFGVVGGALTGWALTVTTLPYLPTPGVDARPNVSAAVALPLALAVGALVGVSLLYGVVVSLRAARRSMNLRMLDADA